VDVFYKYNNNSAASAAAASSFFGCHSNSFQTYQTEETAYNQQRR
jgi:hypothetical protein